VSGDVLSLAPDSSPPEEFVRLKNAVLREARKAHGYTLEDELNQNQSSAPAGLPDPFSDGKVGAAMKPFHDGCLIDVVDRVPMSSSTRIPPRGFTRRPAGSRRLGSQYRVVNALELARPFPLGVCAAEDAVRLTPLQSQIDKAGRLVFEEKTTLDQLDLAIAELKRRRLEQVDALDAAKAALGEAETAAQKVLGDSWKDLLEIAAAVRAGGVDPRFADWVSPNGGPK
jgi:hypothetical protein